ncbi:MAG: hypothetical protein STHCBS139747_000090 [Sporothrix thermara]
MELKTVVIAPTAPHTHTVVFLHGRGGHANSFSRGLTLSRDSRKRNLYEAFPFFRWVFPQAPVRRLANGGFHLPQWFDTWSPADFTEHEEIQIPGLQEVVPAIRQILASEAAQLGGCWDKVILAGISMGGATSAHTMFNLAIPPPPHESTIASKGLGALLTFSSRCPFAGRSLDEMRAVLCLPDTPDNAEVLQNTPMLLEHCVDDHLVPIDTGRALRDTMLRFGAQVTWKEYPHGGHWIHSPTGVDDVVAFFEKTLVQGDRGGNREHCSLSDGEA